MECETNLQDMLHDTNAEADLQDKRIRSGPEFFFQLTNGPFDFNDSDHAISPLNDHTESIRATNCVKTYDASKHNTERSHMNDRIKVVLSNENAEAQDS